MEDRYQSKTECLWYADCCPENRCDGRGKVRAKARRGGGDSVIIPSICRSYWPHRKKSSNNPRTRIRGQSAYFIVF